MNKRIKRYLFLLSAVFCLFFAGCGQPGGQSGSSAQGDTVSVSAVPPYSGQPYISIEDNQPDFTKKEKLKAKKSFESYDELDALGRCGVAYASVGQDIMPTEDRGNIGRVKPTGWHTAKYDMVEGKYLYNRCHLIGYQLTAENANKQNLITGTRYLNVEGMLPFEDMVADYVRETENHVLYRVTPVFDGDDLLAKGVQMEAYSVEDDGDGVCFNVFAYNVQPGITIDYATGESELGNGADEKADKAEMEQVEIRGNRKSKIYHCPGQADYGKMADSPNLVVFHTEQEAMDAGYRRAKR